ncbi:sensor histidine kinase [Streptomyces sp. NPDC052013]|uniref:sensor histidine kinase n=1 Tax=Streptomyces sp. NPDC052013 TaxID=3365679 RepID=UPI0037D2D154
MTRGTGPSSSSSWSDVWQFRPALWAVLWACTAALSAGALAAFPPAGSARTWAAAAVLATALVWHALLAGRLVRGGPGDEEQAAERPAVVLIVLWCAALAAAPVVWLGTAPVSLLLYSTARKPVAHAGSALFAFCGGLAILLSAPGLALGPRLVLAVAAAGYSHALGWWIARIVVESHQRKELLARLERAQEALVEAGHRNGVLTERQRLAREIHDTLTQGFGSIRMLLEAAEAEFATDPEKALRHVRLAHGTAEDNHRQARALVMEGVTEGLASTLPLALERLVEGSWGYEARFRVCGTPRPCATKHEVTLLRAAQESVANIRKHARATSVELTLDYRPGRVVLTVADDGAGFDEAAVPPGGVGIAGMRERIAELGGEVKLCSSPGRGTTVTVSLPDRSG